MKKGLFYFARAITGADGIRMLGHLSILKEYGGVIDHLSARTSDQGRKFIEANTLLRIRQSVNLFGDFYANSARKMPSWMHVYEKLDVTPLKDYDHLFIMGNGNFINSGIGRGLKDQGVFPRCKSALGYDSAGIHIINILAVLKAHNEYGIPLHEYAYDTQELPCNMFHPDVAPKHNYRLYYGYDVPECGLVRLDCHQYHLLNYTSPIKGLFEEEVEKTNDFISGYTTTKKGNRDSYHPELMDLAAHFADPKIYIRNINTDEGSFLSVEEYNEMLVKSRFTFVFPAYDRNVISIDRTIGAIHRDCLPLFHSDCKLREVEDSFDVELEDLKTTKPLNEDKRLQKLAYLKEKIIRFEKNFSDF